MKYDLDDLRARVTAREVAERELGAVIKGNRCAAIWRGGDGQNVEFYDDGCFRDYKTGDHGGPASLLAVAQGMGLKEAADYLGDKYCPDIARKKAPPPARKPASTKPAKAAVATMTMTLTPPVEPAVPSVVNVLGKLRVTPAAAKNRYDELINKGYIVTANYDYQDASGEVIYTVVRMEKDDAGGRKKEFLQKTADGWGLHGARPVLYHMPEVIAADKVYIVEGEKDADFLRQRGFTATTCSGGATKWQDHFSTTLAGKTVVVLGDNDDKGRQHADIIAKSCRGRARSVKVIIPSSKPKGDITDYFVGGKTNADLEELEKSTPEYQPPRHGIVTPEMIGLAKELNKKPFANYVMKKDEDADGAKTTTVPVAMNDLLADFSRRLLGFPYKLGQSTLFDHDKDTREIYEITSPDKLYEWTSRKTGRNYAWKSGPNFVPKREFYEAVFATAPRFEAISDTPDYPENELTYYTFGDIPEPSAGHRYFNEFVDFFCPATPWHRVMLMTFIAAPLWYRPSCTRPSWVIDSVAGTKVGKTSLVERVAALYHCTPIRILRKEIQLHPDEIIKRIISSSGRKSKIALIDNVVGEFHSETLADWITAAKISGRAPYARGEDSRPNNITWVITSNGARLDSDLSGRSFFIALDRKRDQSGRWNERVNRFIEDYRLHVLADVIDILRRHQPFDGLYPATRHAEFEREVLQAMCLDADDYLNVTRNLRDAIEGANTEVDQCHQLVDCIRANLADVPGVNPAEDCVFIHSDLFKAWTQNLDNKPTCQTCRNFARENMTSHFDKVLDRFPRSSSHELRRSGVMWIGEDARGGQAVIVGLTKNMATIKGRSSYEIS